MDKVGQIVFVVDTSVLISDPNVFFKLGSNHIVIPIAVIKELDGLKKSSNPASAKAARKVTRILDELGSSQDIAYGAETHTGAIVTILGRHMTIHDLTSDADNKIVGTALRLRLETGNIDVIVLTTDGNMRNIARAYGMKAENYPLGLNIYADHPNRKSCYSGTELLVNDKAA